MGKDRARAVAPRPFPGVAAQISVAVLGPVVVDGAVRPFRRSASLELVVYLSFHRRRVAYAEWPVAIWPDRAVSLATVHSTASDARRALGRGAGGRWHLPPDGGHLRLSGSVRTDVERFASLASTGDPDHVVDAMHLVRGPLFAGLRRGDWAVLDGTQANVEGLVVAAALRAANAAQGNQLALRATMSQLLALAGDAPGAGCTPAEQNHALTCLHPRTTDLYQALLRGAPATGGVPARL
jgi:hypothetical protein